MIAWLAALVLLSAVFTWKLTHLVVWTPPRRPRWYVAFREMQAAMLAAGESFRSMGAEIARLQHHLHLPVDGVIGPL